MRKVLTLCFGCAVMSTGTAHAESTVSIYGLISAGVGYVSDEGGKSNRHAVSGTNQNPRWGLKGKEDLGGGTSAVFTLEQGFNVMTGSLSQNGRAFGRQAYVGLSDNRFGTLTLGRQYDTVHDYLGPVLIASNGVAIGDNDNAYNDIRIQNSIKYISPRWNGLNLTAVYGLSESTTRSNNEAYSVGVGYKQGPWDLGAVFARMNNPNSASNSAGAVGNDYASSLLLFTKSAVNASFGTARQSIAGAGGLYTLGPALIGAYFSDVKYEYLDGSDLHMQNYDVNINYTVLPKVILGLAYTRTNGKYNVIDTAPHWDQVNLQANYVLSKRSDLFVNVIEQRAGGDATQAHIFGYGASSDIHQSMVTVGMRHRF
jgi:GBP family porin